jgi:hypothetical protein
LRREIVVCWFRLVIGGREGKRGPDLLVGALAI